MTTDRAPFADSTAPAHGQQGTHTAAAEPVLTVDGLTIAFGTGAPVVDGVGFSVARGETVAIVGESGSGKSTTISAVLGLLPPNATVRGSITLAGTELVGANERTLRRLRGSVVALVPQDPMSNLDPVHRVGWQVMEAARAHERLGRIEARDRAIRAMEDAGLELAAERFRQFPHQFSGGMRQRALIAMGMINAPQLLIADEPTSALDVTVQRRILDNLEGLVERTGTAVLLITHDLGLAADRADRVIVMRHGAIIEEGPAGGVLLAPKAAYTRQLVAAAPIVSAPATHTASAAAPPVLLSVEAVTKTYHARGADGRRGTPFNAVADLSIEVRRGQTLAVVGESGSGKSTTAWLALKLTEPTAGRVVFEGADIASLRGAALRDFRRRVQPIFQDPYASLDPMFTVGRILEEPLVAYRKGSAKQRRARVLEMLDQVALPRLVVERHPSELSGGQRQRVAIARALALKPELVVCDEPVSALDVLVQAQILDLLAEIQRDLGLSYLFISHDLGVVKAMAHEVVVMQHGRIIERGTVHDIFDRPGAEYTRALLDAVPGRELYELGPAPVDPPFIPHPTPIPEKVHR